jgi:3-isopropylmalate dehydrogenase
VSHLRDSISEPSARAGTATPVLGVLEGEGVGPEVIRVAMQALHALEGMGLARVDVRFARPAKPSFEDAASFCAGIFAAGGAVLAGPFGGRFVYDLRRRFDLFCKLSPLRPSPALRGATRLKPEALQGVDIVVVRENTGGIYQGRWNEAFGPEGRVAEHTFGYTEAQARRILDVGARLAARRRGRVTIIVKAGGIPSVSRLWCDCGAEAARALGVAFAALDVDYAAYRLVQHAADLDVIVAPNMFGDVLNDLGAVLLGSRGISYSGNYTPEGAGVYQTNHGAAADLAGTGRANPAGQVYSLAMLLRESFGLDAAAALLEAALDDVWTRGFRTADLAEPGCKVVGTVELGDRLADAIARLAARRTRPALAG